MVLLSCWFDWKEALVVVTPKTLWLAPCWVSAVLAVEMSSWATPDPCRASRADPPNGRDNVGWSEERIANELLLKLGIQISPRTVRKYMPKRPAGRRRGEQRWLTFVHNHANVLVACDFLTVANFKCLYVFVGIELGTRKLIHINVTAHPTAAWTLQQLREAIPSDANYKYLLHDRDRIFSAGLDASIKKMGLRVLKSPYRSPLANRICERVIGTLRRECLDFLIPLTELRLLRVVREWARYYNTARPHMSLGPGIPSPPETLPVSRTSHRHRLSENRVISARSVLGGLHHDYQLAAIAT